MSAGYWTRAAEAVIREVFAGLPPDVALQDRVAAVDAAYPFGERQYHPYKMWLKARRQALAPFGHVSRSAKPLPLLEGLSPLEREKAKSLAIRGAQA